MSELKATPGPWVVFWANANEVCVGSERNRLKVPSSLNYSNGACGPNYNAHLIAAAPDLYEELNKARRTIQALIEDGYTGYVDFRCAIDAALAKARGETS